MSWENESPPISNTVEGTYTITDATYATALAGANAYLAGSSNLLFSITHVGLVVDPSSGTESHTITIYEIV